MQLSVAPVSTSGRRTKQGRESDPDGYRLRPVAAVQAWLKTTDITDGHSGFLTSAAETDASVFRMMAVSRRFSGRIICLSASGQAYGPAARWDTARRHGA